MVRASPLPLLLAGVTILLAQLPSVTAQDRSRRDRQLAPQRWWCAPARGNSGSMFCKTAVLKEAIAMAEEPAQKDAAVSAFKSSVLKGNAEAEGMDATNPERQRMMEAWCASNDEARADPKTNVMCAKAKAKSDFLKRRQMLIDFWCVKMGKAGSPKCKQMEFGKLMSETDSGEERKKAAAQFNANRGSGETQQAMDAETKELMKAACDGELGKTELFATTCAKLRTEL